TPRVWRPPVGPQVPRMRRARLRPDVRASRLKSHAPSVPDEHRGRKQPPRAQQNDEDAHGATAQERRIEPPQRWEHETDDDGLELSIERDAVERTGEVIGP